MKRRPGLRETNQGQVIEKDQEVTLEEQKERISRQEEATQDEEETKKDR
jgi:hypothetical protein